MIPNDGKMAFTAKEIDELLKRGAYDVFRDDDAAEQVGFIPGRHRTTSKAQDNFTLL